MTMKVKRWVQRDPSGRLATSESDSEPLLRYHCPQKKLVWGQCIGAKNPS
jgi:hypothetical protein